MNNNNIPLAQLPAFDRDAPTDPQVIERGSTYKVWRVTLPFTDAFGASFNRLAAPIKCSGDTLTVLSVDGPHVMGIAVNRGNEYLTVHEGTVITRDLSEVSVKAFSGVPPLNVNPTTLSDLFKGAVTTVTFATSWGKLIETPFRFVEGLRGQFPMGSGAASPTGVRLMDIFNGPENNFPIEVLKYGGTLIVKNLDLGADLFLYWGVGGDFVNTTGSGSITSQDGAWKLSPGEGLIITARSRLSQRTKPDGTPGVTLCVASASSGRYNVICSDWGDASDPDSSTGGNFAFRTDRSYGKS